MKLTSCIIFALFFPIVSIQADFAELVHNSREFFQAPTEANALVVLAPTHELQAKVLEFAKETRPLLDPKVLVLISDFLRWKREVGTVAEKKLYHSMTEAQFLERLLSKRPLMFMNSRDDCLLRDGTRINKTANTAMDFKNVVHDEARLADYISYDEMQIGALVSIAGPSFFINDGGKTNQGKPGIDNTFEKEAIICGSVGCRFEREGLMEYQHLLVTKNQHVPNSPWCDFYGISHFPTYAEAVGDNFIEVLPEVFLNSELYKKRLKLSYEPFIQDMNRRAEEKGVKAYVRLTGLGLGVWAINKEIQTNLMLEVIEEIVQGAELAAISDIEFMYVTRDDTQWQDANGNSINVRFTKNTTCTKLEPEHEGKLLGANYAWDSASFPGNEYWIGALSASMDPATASASQIKDLHNIYINPYLKRSVQNVSF